MQATNTIEAWLKRASDELKAVNVPSAALDAEIILAHTLRKPRTWLHIHGSEPLNSREWEIANARLDLRLDRVPVAYIVGHKEFYGRRFKVTTATLIPRPETESLIELINEVMPANTSLLEKTERPLRLVDVGTGSGNIGITAKLQHPQLDVTLIDTSRHALNIAEENAANLQAEVSILQSHLITNFPFSADIIVANLPYVNPNWERSPETQHEPSEALFAENNGLALIFELLSQTKEKLRSGGSLILEADPEQHDSIRKEAARFGLLLVKISGYGMLFNKI